MQIAQSSVNIDENAKLANSAKDHSDENKKKTESFMKGKITRSYFSPQEADDHNSHQDGDMWTKIQDDGHGGSQAVDMWQFQDGKWQPTKWDAETMNVKKLSALSEDVGELHGGTITGVQLNSTEINVDIDGGTGAHDSGHNSLGWSSNGEFSVNDYERGSYYGFHFRNGLMSFKGQRISSSNGDGIGSTDSLFLGPNDVKLRNSKGSDTGNAMKTRVDIRSNYIVVGESWYDSDCARIYPSNNGEMFAGVGGFDHIIAYSDIRANSGWLQVNSTLHSSYDLRADGEGNFGSVAVGSSGLNNSGLTNLKGGLNVSGSNWAGQGINTTSSLVVTNGGVYAPNGNISTDNGTVYAQHHALKSELSSKKVLDNFNNKKSLSEILGTDIFKFHYQNENKSTNIGPIIDNINELDNLKYNTSSYLVTSDDNEHYYLSINNAIGMLIGSIHELSSQNEKLLQRIIKLEGV